MNMCFNEAVVDVLFYHESGLVSWWVHLFKLTTKHILVSKHVLIVISRDSIIIRSQSMGYYWSVTKCE